jgi:hypothetical protein
MRPEEKRFRFLTTTEFNRLAQADKIAYLELAMVELKRKGLLAGQGSLFTVRSRRSSPPRRKG